MARSRSYWPVVRHLREKYDLTLGEARSGWRVLRDLFEGDKPTVAELKRHPVVSERVARDLVVKRADVFEKPAVEREREPAALAPKVEEEWQVSISYKDAKGRYCDLAIHVLGPAGADAKQIRGVVWRALLGHSLDVFTVVGVDWSRSWDKGGGSVTQYEQNDLVSFKSFAHSGTWRIALIGE